MSLVCALTRTARAWPTKPHPSREHEGVLSPDGLGHHSAYHTPNRPLSPPVGACKKCRETPILLIPLSPPLFIHFFTTPESARLTPSWRVQKVSADPYSIDTTFPLTIYTLFYHPRIGPSRPQLARAKGVARAPHPNERTRGAKLVARAAEGGSEHEREVRITWVSLGLGSSG